MNEERHYAFFQNRECEFFPCHKGADAENFNCQFPHKRENYDKITGRFQEIVELIRE